MFVSDNRTKPRTLGNDNDFTLHLGLPKMLDLSGLPFFQRWNVDHEQFIGSTGVLYVSCDWRAHFWSRAYLYDDSEERSFKNYDLRSSDGFGTKKFQRFKIEGDGLIRLDYLLTSVVGSDKGQIIRRLSTHEGLSIYLQQFFGWVNEFATIYSEGRFYNPLDGVNRFTGEFYDDLPGFPMHKRIVAIPAVYLEQNVNQ